MPVVIRMRLRSLDLVGTEPLAAPAGFPLRLRSWAASLGIHLAVIAFAFLLPPGAPRSRRPNLDEYIRPNRHRIVYYPLRPKPVPVRPDREFGDSEKPRAPVQAADTMVANAPPAASPNRLVYRPETPPEIRAEAAPPPRPLPPPPPPSTPPKPRLLTEARIATPAPAPAKPLADGTRALAQLSEMAPPPRPRKAFVPPEPVRVAKAPRLIVEAGPVPILAPAPQPLPAAGAASSLSNLAPKPVRPFVAPQPAKTGLAQPAFISESGPMAPAPPIPGATVDRATAANPLAGIVAPRPGGADLPDGDKAGKVSRAPQTGDPASGKLAGVPGVVVPNLIIQPAPAATPVPPAAAPPASVPRPAAAGSPRVIQYADRLRSVPLSTLSVPLRPASRSIPAALESRFRGRTVYTVVIPIENFPEYSGDWILWFAETNPAEGASTAAMRAPLPLRKRETWESPASLKGASHRVQATGLLQRDGKLAGLQVTSRGGSEAEQAARRDLLAWEFKPAARNGQPVEVEVVLELTLVIPGAPLVSGRP